MFSPLTEASISGVESTMVLPFGLALAKGASLRIDDGATSTPFPSAHALPPALLLRPERTGAFSPATGAKESIRMEQDIVWRFSA